MRPGWNEEYTQAIQEAKEAKRRYQIYHDWEDDAVSKQADRRKKKILMRAQADDHRRRVSEVKYANQLFSLNRWLRTRGASIFSFLPNIEDKTGLYITR